jgi:hypothetical protein
MEVNTVSEFCFIIIVMMIYLWSFPFDQCICVVRSMCDGYNGYSISGPPGVDWSECSVLLEIWLIIRPEEKISLFLSLLFSQFNSTIIYCFATVLLNCTLLGIVAMRHVGMRSTKIQDLEENHSISFIWSGKDKYELKIFHSYFY